MRVIYLQLNFRIGWCDAHRIAILLKALAHLHDSSNICTYNGGEYSREEGRREIHLDVRNAQFMRARMMYDYSTGSAAGSFES